jgi:hypothetical protein
MHHEVGHMNGFRRRAPGPPRARKPWLFAAFTQERRPSEGLCMSRKPPAFEWSPNPCRRGLLALLGSTAVLPACASDGAAGAISAITLERDCNGCRTGSRLELQRSGEAVLTLTGKARLGTQDRVSRARITPADFAALANAAVAAGFFAMAETYEAEGLQDGPWAMLGLQRGSVVKQVFRRDEAGPPALRALEAAVLQLQSRLVFVPD